MAERMYRNVTGWHPEDNKHDATHVFLTTQEYASLNATIKHLKSENAELSQKHRNELLSIKQEAEAYKNKLAQEAAAKIGEAQKRADAMEKEANRQKQLNENLLRISKERANAKRGLQPKRKHSGYRFVGKIRQIRVVKSREKGKATTYALVWTATIETPYAATIPIETITDKVASELAEMLGKISIGVLVMTNDEKIMWRGSYTEAVKTCNEQKLRDVVFDHKYMANAKSGFWEIEITTIKPIAATAAMLA